MEPENVVIAESMARRCVEALHRILPNPPSKQKIIELRYVAGGGCVGADPGYRSCSGCHTGARTRSRTYLECCAKGHARCHTCSAPSPAQSAADELMKYKICCWIPVQSHRRSTTRKRGSYRDYDLKYRALTETRTQLLQPCYL